MGRNETYLHQFLHRGVPAELHENDRATLAEILKVPEDALRGQVTRSRAVPPRKNTSPATETIEPATDQAYTPPRRNHRVADSAAELFGERVDLPVFGTVQGGSIGALIVTDRPVDWVCRPPALLRVVDGYGVIVSGDSMSPEFKPGAIALVNPHAKPRVGDSCVFRCHDDDGSTQMLIKEYRGETETHWKVHQHNPPRDFTLPKKQWQVCHKTVGSYFA